MNPTAPSIRRLLLLFLALLGLGAGRVAASDDLGTLYMTFPPFVGLTQVEVGTAIAQSLVARHWDVREKNEARVVGYIDHRAYEATVTFVHKEDGSVEFYCLGYVRSEFNGAKSRKLPKGWLENLRRDILSRASARAGAQGGSETPAATASTNP